MIRILNADGHMKETSYRLGQLEQALDAIQAAGLKITNTVVDLDNKNLDITVHVKEAKV